MTFKPGDSKREEFRKYLEKAGVLDALTRVLARLYEESEKPEDAMGFIKEKLKVGSPDANEAHIMQKEIQELKQEIERLNKELAQLKEQNESETPQPSLGE